MLREYLNRECAAQTTINRAVLLWASAKVPGLLEPEKQKAIITELLVSSRPTRLEPVVTVWVLETK